MKDYYKKINRIIRLIVVIIYEREKIINFSKVSIFFLLIAYILQQIIIRYPNCMRNNVFINIEYEIMLRLQYNLC